jgi:hypothetical protein
LAQRGAIGVHPSEEDWARMHVQGKAYWEPIPWLDLDVIFTKLVYFSSTATGRPIMIGREKGPTYNLGMCLFSLGLVITSPSSAYDVSGHGKMHETGGGDGSIRREFVSTSEQPAICAPHLALVLPKVPQATLKHAST